MEINIYDMKHLIALSLVTFQFSLNPKQISTFSPLCPVLLWKQGGNETHSYCLATKISNTLGTFI